MISCFYNENKLLKMIYSMSLSKSQTVRLTCGKVPGTLVGTQQTVARETDVILTGSYILFFIKKKKASSSSKSLVV